MACTQSGVTTVQLPLSQPTGCSADLAIYSPAQHSYAGKLTAAAPDIVSEEKQTPDSSSRCLQTTLTRSLMVASWALRSAQASRLSAPARAASLMALCPALCLVPHGVVSLSSATGPGCPTSSQRPRTRS